MARTRHLQDRTQAERGADIATLSKLSLKELRRRQEILKGEQAQAFRMYKSARARNNGPDLDKAEKIGKSLDLKFNDLFEAVDRVSFPEDYKDVPFGKQRPSEAEKIVMRQADEEAARIAAEKKSPSAAEMTAEERARFGIPDPTPGGKRVQPITKELRGHLDRLHGALEKAFERMDKTPESRDAQKAVIDYYNDALGILPAIGRVEENHRKLVSKKGGKKR